MNTDNHGEENSPFRRRRLPSLNALRCFEAAARLENFSRAAEALCLTHGAISRAVRTLEEELGCALFERRGQRVFLSEAGRRLLAGTGPALDLIERTGETLRAEAGPTDRRAALRALLPEPAGGRRRTRRGHRSLATGARRSGRRPAGGATGIPRRRQQLSPADPATVAGRRACHAAAGMAAPQRGGLMRPAQGQARSARSTTASRRSQGTRSLACTLRPNSTVA